MREIILDEKRGTAHRSRITSGENIVYDVLTTKNDITGRWRLTIDATSHGNEFRVVVMDVDTEAQANALHKMALRYSQLFLEGAWALKFEVDARERLATGTM